MLYTDSTTRDDGGGSPRVALKPNADKPPATPDDIEAAWSKYDRLPEPDDDHYYLLKPFLDARGLDTCVANSLVNAEGVSVFGHRVVEGTGAVIGFHGGDGIKRRALWPKEGHSGRLVEPTDKSKTWTGITVVRPQARAEASDTVILCESETDLWSLAQLVPSADLALMPAGARDWQESWASVLRGYPRVLVATDADPAGDEGARKVASDLPDAVRLRPFGGVKDWNEAMHRGLVTPEAMATLVEQASERIPTPLTIDRGLIRVTGERLAEVLDAPLSHPAVAAEVHRALGRGVTREATTHILHTIENPPPELTVVTGAGILEARFPERTDVLTGGQLITGEVMGWYGPGGVGKSLLLMQLGLSMAYGVPFLTDDLCPARPLRVLFASGEGRAEMHQRRYRAIEAHVASHPDASPDGRSRYMALRGGGPVPLRLDLPSHVSQLRAIVEEHGIEVLLLDSFRTLHSANENASEEMEVVWAALRGLLDDTGTAAIVTHHMRKGAGKNRREAARGGSFQENIATAWAIDYVDRDRSDGPLVIEPTKTRNGPVLPRMTVERDPETLCCSAGENEDGKHPELAEALRERGGSALVTELASDDLNPKSVKRWARAEPDIYGVEQVGEGVTAPLRVSLLARVS
ncbi:MAG TPA: AAA family ATPase [Phycisphaerales bacterium]|nr:AAA family ATPase [Phycisphaerales bacterium]